jgi:hypothetical protein
MFAVTTDNDELDYYDGSAWVPALPIGAWQSWAPTLGGGWLNGNGVWDAKYVQIGKTVHIRGSFTLGSSTTKGSGVTFTLPVAPGGIAIGTMTSNRCAGTSGQLMWNLIETNVGVMYAVNTAGTYMVRAGITATVPATWATGDILTIGMTYEAA